jgi:hypothetical protein
MKAYLCVLLIVAAAMILGTVAASVIVDPYRIVHPLIGEFSFEPNSRVSKTRFLSHGCSQYDSYFVGDSRSATLSQGDLGDVEGGRFYNFSTPADDIASIVRRLNFLIAAGCRISTVVVEESIDVLLDRGALSEYSLLLSENPAVSGENRIAFYSRYFLGAQALDTYFRALLRDPSHHDIYYPDGHVDYLWGMEDGTAFALPQCDASNLKITDKNLLLAKLAGYREIARLSDQYHFRAIVWIAPLNKWQSSFLDDPAIQDFLRQLRALPGLPVIEADRDSPLLADFRNWHDCGHFRRTVFDQLVAPGVSRFLRRPAAPSSPAEKSS